jgi:hypothetical protein
MTPHTLRRTFASILAACDVPPRRAMYLMGHTDPTLTLAVYQHVLDMGRGSVGRLEEMLGCSLAEARAIYNGERVAAGVSVLRRKKPLRADRTLCGGGVGNRPFPGKSRKRLKGLEPSTFCMAIPRASD